MVRSKKNRSSKKSLNNVRQTQFNYPRRNVSSLDEHTVDMDQQNYNMSNAKTQLPEWKSTLTINEILNSFIGGPSPDNSLFTSGYGFIPQSNFHPKFDCNSINSKNGMHTLQDESNFHLISEYNSSFGTSNNGPRDNIGSQYSDTEPLGLERHYGKHQLLTNVDDYFSFNMMKTSNSGANEFILRNEDFPELPRTQMYNVANNLSSMIDLNQQWSFSSIGFDLFNSLNMDQFINKPSKSHLDTTDFHMNGFTVPQAGVQTSLENGKVSNIPGSMLRDQFGVIGQLISLRTAEYNSKLVGLTFGEDLTSLGMNMNSLENIYPTFAGPFVNSPLEPHNLEFKVPPEYIINHKIEHRLAPIKLPVYNEDVLFYLFYTYYGDAMQMAVASELRTRGWRFHTEERIWITPVSGSYRSEINCHFNHGKFDVFDVQLWRKVTRVLTFNYNVLDVCIANISVIPPATSTE